MTTTASTLKNDLTMYGPLSVVARVRWSPSSADLQTLTDAVGVLKVARSSTGVYVVHLMPGIKSVQATIRAIDDSITLYQWPEVTAVSPTARTVSCRLRNKAFASVAGAPDASDTCDELEVLVWGRTAS